MERNGRICTINLFPKADIGYMCKQNCGHMTLYDSYKTFRTSFNKHELFCVCRKYFFLLTAGKLRSIFTVA